MDTELALSRVTDHELLAGWYALYDRCADLDDPSGPRPDPDVDPAASFADPVRGLMHGQRSFVGWWSDNTGAIDQETWLLCDADGEVLGGYVLEIPLADYLDLAFCFVVVDPAQRRRGLGRRLTGSAARRLAEIGRSTVLYYPRDDSAGDAFVRAIGATVAGTADGRRVLELGEAHRERLDRVRSSLPAAGEYELLSWEDPAEEELLPGLATLLDAMADAPRPGVMAAEQWSPARVRESEARMRARGTTRLTVVALERAGGTPVALTEVLVRPGFGSWGFQGRTVVLPSHRGRSLGLLVKSVLDEELRQRYPEVTRLMTTNNAVNRHINAVNERLGFEAVASFTPWELPVDRARGLG